jgi:DNA-binding FadR family transcriptional regulator
MPFQTVATQRLYQQVAQQISDLIRAGELPEGGRLPAERDLAKRLGVSRPTVREAMIALEIAGFVEVRTGSGIYVRSAAGERAARAEPAARFDAGPGPFELLQARLLIEPEIAAAAARHATAADVAAIEESIRSLETASNHKASIDADQQFHSLVANATGNDVLVGIVNDLWTSMSSPIFEALSSRTGLPETDGMTVADHRTILRKIAQHEPDQARRAMREHLEHVEAILASPEMIVRDGAPSG